jgi:AraC-like DNA-binding protein
MRTDAISVVFGSEFPPEPCSETRPINAPFPDRAHCDLANKHLSRALEHLFIEFTGLRFRVVWVHRSPTGSASRSLQVDQLFCCKWRGSPLDAECKACGSKRLAAALKSRRGHVFTCRLGVRNCWFPIRLRGQTAVILYLQALNRSPRRGARKFLSVPAPHKASRPANAKLHREITPVLSRLRFARAARLLRHIARHVQTACLNELRESDLLGANQAVLALEREQARLSKSLQHNHPASSELLHNTSASHSRQIVHGLLEKIEQDYGKPISLRLCARDLGMNAAYLSAIFSHGVGTPFKAYLTEVRLHKAKELLGNSANTASKVAFAVGYSSEERFRRAFKKATGLSPRTWRKTMRVAPRNGPV